MSSSTTHVLHGPRMLPDLQAEAAPPATNADSAPGEEDLELGRPKLDLRTTFSNPCLKLFLADRDTPPQRLRALLAAAWAHDATTALKLVCNLRGVRGGGKGDREGFYTAALWMHQRHPRTLAASANLAAFAEFGYIKDLPEILYRLIHGGDVREVAKARSEAKGWSFPRCPPLAVAGRKRPRTDDDDDPASAIEEPPVDPTKTGRGRKHKKPADVFRLAQLALNKYRGDQRYHRLFNSIADFFADSLRGDLDKHNNGDSSKISLAAKWCPSVGSTIDQSTLLCEAIARRIFPRADYTSLTEDQYVYRVLGRFRREVLVPLRKVLELPEMYISQGRWSQLPYHRVPKEAMRLYTPLFKKHDGVRFDKYLSDVEAGISNKAGKRKLAEMPAGALLPHELVILMAKEQSPRVDQAVSQWRRIVDDIATTNLCPTLRFIYENLPHDEKLDLESVFTFLLAKGDVEKLKEEDMVRTIFILTDRNPDPAYEKQWRAKYKKLRSQFKDNGFKDAVPQVVMWNLAGPRSPALTKSKNGIMTLSGFSNDLMRLFLDMDGIVEAEDEMWASIAGDEYKKVVVINEETGGDE
ncbi:unnamed protein product [Urochloa decumbens]|uniref:Uncharacterized protein n=1 Tax=Urochloa decumbens TaxID=240449 RepID=A0ABC8YQD2_9POAL